MSKKAAKSVLELAIKLLDHCSAPDVSTVFEKYNNRMTVIISTWSHCIKLQLYIQYRPKKKLQLIGLVGNIVATKCMQCFHCGPNWLQLNTVRAEIFVLFLFSQILQVKPSHNMSNLIYVYL